MGTKTKGRISLYEEIHYLYSSANSVLGHFDDKGEWNQGDK
jgi:hypothetical protein